MSAQMAPRVRLYALVKDSGLGLVGTVGAPLTARLLRCVQAIERKDPRAGEALRVFSGLMADLEVTT